MQEKLLYEYAIIRIVPLVEREEFLNVGIVLFCKREKYISVRSKLDENKLHALCKEVDIDLVKKNLESFEKIALGIDNCGPIAAMDIPSRFRWLTAVKSTILQTSRPHAGLCDDLELTVNKLFEELVL